MIRASHSVTRRSLLVGGGAAAIAAACGGSDSGDDASGGDVPASQLFLQPGFADGLRTAPFLVAGREQLAPIVIAGETGQPLRLDETPANLEVVISTDGEAVTSQLLPARGEGIFIPHYSPLMALDEPGLYTLSTDVDGQMLSFDFRVAGTSEVPYLGAGDMLVPVATPTTADARGVEPICTFLPDPCPFHDTSLDVAIDSALPIVFLIATPAFCQTAICGPVVDMLIQRFTGTNAAAVVHAEVWQNEEVVLTPGGTTDAVNTYELGHEPALWIADPGGAVTARLDFAWDVAELNEALATAGL